ncbi:MAG: terminase [Dorea sp.]|nr:terminase [Dorea sp.]
MPRARSPKRDEAYKMWLDSNGKTKLKDIASALGVSESQVRKWKNQDKWNSNVTNQLNGNVTNQLNGNVTKRKRGGQPGNHNATGPPGNKNAEKFGFFSKYLPEETVSIIQEMPTDPLDILWDQIQISYAAIIRAQQIMYVKDKNDKTIEKVEEKAGKVIGEKWEVQQAWDKQANFLQAQARAMSDLRGSIRQYDDLLHKRWDLATDEQKARIEQMKANTDRLRRDSPDEEEDGVEILNDAAEEEAGTDIGDHHSEVPQDI